jgi:hypothetical protein
MRGRPRPAPLRVDARPVVATIFEFLIARRLLRFPRAFDSDGEIPLTAIGRESWLCQPTSSFVACCFTCCRTAFVRIRNFGFLANRRREELLPLCFLIRALLQHTLAQNVPPADVLQQPQLVRGLRTGANEVEIEAWWRQSKGEIVGSEAAGEQVLLIMICKVAVGGWRHFADY